MKSFRILTLTLCLVAIAVVGRSTPVQAQSVDAPTDTVSVSPKSPFVAGALEWLLPTAGYAYAGNWERGLLPGAARVGGLAIFMATFEWNLFRGESKCGSGCMTGLILGLAGSLWAVFDASAEARRYNERIRSGTSVRVVPELGVHGGFSARRIAARRLPHHTRACSRARVA